MDFNSYEFKEFIDFGCNRQKFIQDFLQKNGIECPAISLEGKNHIYVKFPQSQYNPLFKIKTVVAHYDRVANSPGANDNSAAVFCLLNWAVKLFNRKSFHNVRLIFTDGEEVAEQGVSSQGAFALAAFFKKLCIDDDVFVFDCMGRGDVPVLAETVLPKKISASFVKKFAVLEKRAENLIKSAGGGKWFCLPCNYSDNAGFIANGIPAVAFTLLPSNEVSDVLKNKTPKTWQLLHSPFDNFESLWQNSFDLTMKILDFLAEMK